MEKRKKDRALGLLASKEHEKKSQPRKQNSQRARRETNKLLGEVSEFGIGVTEVSC